MRRIYFSVFGSGLGHATRINEISNKLKRGGDEFIFSSFEEGLDYLRAHNLNPLKSPSIDLKWNSDGGFSSRDSFLGFPKAILTFARQLDFESDVISRFKPGVVVSDSRISPIIAARAKNVPVVTLLNQFKVLFPSRFRNKPLSHIYERMAGNMLGLFWSLSDQVLLSDLPPPYTISEANVAGTNVSSVIRYIGFTSPKFEVSKDQVERVRSTLGFDKRKIIFIQISGPNATKKRFIDSATLAVAGLTGKFNVVVSLGFPNGSSEPKKLAGGAWLYEWCPIKNELFFTSDVVVARAGHGTIGQCISLGTPAVLVPIYNHSEQIANAEKYQKLGLGLEIKSEELTPDRIKESIVECVEDSSYKQTSLKVKEISSRYRGADDVVAAVETCL